MIRINLLAERKQQNKPKKAEIVVSAEGRKSLALPVLLAIIIAGTCFVVGLAYFLLNMNVEGLTSEYSDNTAKIAEYKKKIEEVKKYEELNKAIEARTNLINSLKKSQATPVRLLDDISKLLPDDVWITSVTYNSPQAVVGGVAFTNNEVVAFVDSLKKSADYTDVYLEESKQGTVDNVDVYIFKLNFRTRI
jgi:type IV pilus assembly protein PilN